MQRENLSYVNYPEYDYSYRKIEYFGGKKMRGMYTQLLILNKDLYCPIDNINFNYGECDWQEDRNLYGKNGEDQVLALIMLGTTKDVYENKYTQAWFVAKYEDFTDEGKKIYELLRVLYPNAIFDIITNVVYE